VDTVIGVSKKLHSRKTQRKGVVTSTLLLIEYIRLGRKVKGKARNMIHISQSRGGKQHA